MPCAQRGAFALQTQPTRTERIIVTNRKALHEYEILQRFQAGIQLTGTEVKSIRAGKISLAEAYATFPSRTSDELLLLGMHINPYDFGNRENHEPMRPRKLLLHRHELHRLRIATEEKGLTIIPLSVFFSGPFIKVELGFARGKKLYDKRESIKERDEKRRMNRDERD